MSGANASPIGRSHQEMSGANASATARSHQEMSGANASAIARSHQGMSGAIPAIVCIVMIIAAPLMAHHGTGGIYDMQKAITLKGTVTMFKFVNPHVLVYFDVSENDKKSPVMNWLGEGPSVINWTRTGWNRNSVK